MPAEPAAGTVTEGGAVAVAAAAGAAALNAAAADGAGAAVAAGIRWGCWDCRALVAGVGHGADSVCPV